MRDFMREVNDRIATLACDDDINTNAAEFMRDSVRLKYSYNWFWQGRPIIQYPQDIVAMQEIIWNIKPDLIIETGIAHGGSLVFSASMLAQLDICDAIKADKSLDPRKSSRKVLGVDIDIRAHNLEAIQSHPMASRITMIQGSSIAPDIISRVKDFASDYSRILVCLDSNHTHNHVLSELEAYAPLTTVGSYCIVFDTIIDDMPANMYPDRSWGPENNPKTAAKEYLKNHKEFKIHESIQHKLQITVAPDGFLERIS